MPRPNRGPHLHWNARREVWEVRWFEQGQRRSRSTGTRDRRAAESDLVRFINAAHAEPDTPAGRIIADVLNDYAEEHGRTIANRAGLSFAIERLTEFWGDQPVSAINERACRAYARHRERGGNGRRPVTAGTYGNELLFLRAAINHDHAQRRLTHAVKVWSPERPEPRKRWLRRDEVAAMLRAARAGQRSDHLTRFIVIGLYTGARHEAVLSLRRQQVDLREGTVDLNRPGRAPTSKGRAVIQAPERLLMFLRLWCRGLRPTDPIVRYHGDAVASVRKAWKLARERAGLGPEVRPSSLRHTCASWQMQAGVPSNHIAKWLGHTTSKQVERTYGHLAPQHLQASRSALDGRGRRGNK